MLVLTLSLALAQSPSSDTLVDQAIGRIETGDYEGAQILLDASLEAPAPDPDHIAYLQGVTLELDGDPAAAVVLYNEGLEQWPDSGLHDDRIFRKTEATATLGHSRRALRILRQLDEEAFAGEDELKLNLVTGIAWLAAGKTRKGTAILGPALEQATPEQVSFYQAKARIAWARVVAEDAGRLRLRGRESKVTERLSERATLLTQVEQQVTAAARLQEPEWVLDGLLVLGAAYADIAEDLLNSSRPKGLTDGQLVEYDRLIGEHAMVVFVKASRHYGSGLDMATRLGWQSRRVAQLEAAKQALDTRIEALDSNG